MTCISKVTTTHYMLLHYFIVQTMTCIRRTSSYCQDLLRANRNYFGLCTYTLGFLYRTFICSFSQRSYAFLMWLLPIKYRIDGLREQTML
jgi:hypothetical protein